MTTESKETAREKATRLLSTNPRFKEAPKTGQGFVIVGARPSTKPDGAVKYGSFESFPARFTEREAWVYYVDRWCKIPIAEVQIGAAAMTEDDYREAFGNVPPMPMAAFNSGK